jgi:hypothetical protein
MDLLEPEVVLLQRRIGEDRVVKIQTDLLLSQGRRKKTDGKDPSTKAARQELKSLLAELP